MSFAFSQQEPRTSGMVEDPPIPLNRYLGAAFHQGDEDSIKSSLDNIYDYLSKDSGDKLSVEEANHRYGFPGMSFTDPVSDERAKLISERRKSEMDRAFYLQSGNPGGPWSGRGLMGMGASMVGAVSNPIDFASMFIPFVGEERAASVLARAGAGRLRQGLARGLIQQEMIGGPFPKFSSSMIQGMMYQSMAEFPQIISKYQEQQPIGPGDFVRDVALGGAFAGAIHAGTHGLLRLLSRDTREEMFRKALNDTLEGKSMDVRDVVKLDPEVIRQSVQFDEARARDTAMRAIPIEDVKKAVKDQLGEEVVSAAIKYGDGTVKTDVSHEEIMNKSGDIQDPNAIEGFVTDKGRFLTRMQAAILTGLPDAFMTHLELPHNATYGNITPEERSFANAIRESGASEEEALAEVTRARWRNNQDMTPAMKSLVEEEHARRLQEFVDKKRQEFNDTRELDRKTQAEIKRQQQAGRVLSDSDKKKFVLNELDPTKDMPTLEEANKMLEEELGINDEENFPSAPGEKSLGILDKLDKALENLKIGNPGDMHIAGIPVLLWNGAIEAVRLAIRAGRDIAEAIEEGVRHLRENWGKSPEDVAKEIGATFKPVSSFKMEGVPTQMADELKKIHDASGWEFTPQSGDLRGRTFYTKIGATREEILEAYGKKQHAEITAEQLKKKPQGMSLRSFLKTMSTAVVGQTTGVAGKILEGLSRPSQVVKKLLLPKISLADLARMAVDTFNDGFESGTATHPKLLSPDHPLADFLSKAGGHSRAEDMAVELMKGAKSFEERNLILDTPLSELQAQGKIPEKMVKELYGKLKAVANLFELNYTTEGKPILKIGDKAESHPLGDFLDEDKHVKLLEQLLSERKEKLDEQKSKVKNNKTGEAESSSLDEAIQAFREHVTGELEHVNEPSADPSIREIEKKFAASNLKKIFESDDGFQIFIGEKDRGGEEGWFIHRPEDNAIEEISSEDAWHTIGETLAEQEPPTGPGGKKAANDWLRSNMEKTNEIIDSARANFENRNLQDQVKQFEEQKKAHLSALDTALSCMLEKVI